jgi:hypothetical protein
MQQIDPKIFGLPARTVLEQIDDRTVAIVMRRKSRIIMADGRKIIEKADTIRKRDSSLAVVLKTSAPVCSKTIQQLEQAKITTAPL